MVIGSTIITDSDPTLDDVIKLWYMRLGHMSERGMTILSKRGLLCGQCTSSLEFYEHCVFDKQKRLSFSTDIHRTKGILDYIHLDLWVPSREPSKNNSSHYLLTFIDDFSRNI
jgi:GAG-pre-integrase domain